MNLIVTNLAGESLPLLDYRPPMRTRNIDGTHTLSVTIPETAKNKRAFRLIEAEGKLFLDDNTYRIRQMQRKVKDNVPQTEITALHTFFDIIHNYQYDVIEGEKVLTLHQGLTHAFENTDITFIIEDDFESQSFENFGDANSLNLFEKLRTEFDFEFTIENDTFLRIRKQIGATDKPAQMRWKHNIVTIDEEVDTTNLATYVKGYGKPKEDEDGNVIEGEYVVTAEYTSPNAHLYDELYHAKPIYDARFVHEEALINYMKKRIVDEPELSYTITYDELQKTGVESLELGDSAFLIHEVLGLDFNTRAVEVIDFPTHPNIKPVYTISSKKESMTDKQVQANADKDAMKDDIKWSINKQKEIDRIIAKNTEAVADVENAMKHVEEEMERLENEVLPEIEEGVESSKIPSQTEPPTEIPESKLWWDTSVNPPRLKRWNGDKWVVLANTEEEIDDLINGMKDDINYNIIPTINKSETGYQIEAPKIDIKGLVEFVNDKTNILPNNFEAWERVLDVLIRTKNYITVKPNTYYTFHDSDPSIINANTWAFEISTANETVIDTITTEDDTFTFKTTSNTYNLRVMANVTDNTTLYANKATITEGEEPLAYEDATSTVINGGKIATDSISANQLDVNNIFANSAVVEKIQADIVRTTELDAGKINVGTLNGENVNIINLSASSLISGTIDASKIRVRNLNASEINTGSLAAERISAGTITKSGTLAVDIGGGSIDTYKGSNLTSRINGDGQRFYRDREHIGNIGTSTWKDMPTKRGLVFQMTNDCDYMSWGHDHNRDNVYTTKFSWFRDTTINPPGFHFDDNVNIKSNYRLSVRHIGTTGYSSGSRSVGLANLNWNGEEGVALGRGSAGDLGRVFLGLSTAALIDDGNAHIEVGRNSSGNYVRSVDINNQTSSLSANVGVGSSGLLFRSSSASKYKLLIENEEDKGYSYENVLDLNIKSWYDKLEADTLAKLIDKNLLNDDKENKFYLRRHFGLTAEDVERAGLKEFVRYNDETGEVEGIEYDRLWTLLIPIVREQKEENKQLKSRLDEMEKQLEQLVS